MGVEGFDPATSVGNVIVVVPDAESLYAAFAAGLRRHCGRVPSAGVPRLLRPRRKQGTAVGFTVVDVGGNWLRFYQATDAPDAPETGGNKGTAVERSAGLARVLEIAARQGDARGDDAQALQVLERGLRRHPDGPALGRVRVLLYQLEVLVRLGEVVPGPRHTAQASRVEPDRRRPSLGRWGLRPCRGAARRHPVRTVHPAGPGRGARAHTRQPNRAPGTASAARGMRERARSGSPLRRLDCGSPGAGRALEWPVRPVRPVR